MEPLTDLPIVLSYTNVSHYLTCPKQFWHRDLKKDATEKFKTYAQRSGSGVHEHLKKRLKIREPLPSEYQHHEGICAYLEKHNSIKHMEVKLGVDRSGNPVDFFDSSVALRGVLDLACSDAPHGLLVDWKNGRPWEDPLELKFQAVLLAARWPELTHITGFFYWLRESKIGTLHELDPVAAWKSIGIIAEAIAGRMRRGNDFPPDEGPLCPWCPVPKGEGGPLDPVCKFRKDPK